MTNLIASTDGRRGTACRQRRGLYSLPEVAQLVGVERETFRYHVKRGYLVPPHAGQGKRKYYLAADLPNIIAYWN